jgi:hypothetical protein
MFFKKEIEKGKEMAEEKKTPKVLIDDTEYDYDALSDTAKNLLGFLQKLDQEIKEKRFSLDAALLARKQAVADLKIEIE